MGRNKKQEISYELFEWAFQNTDDAFKSVDEVTTEPDSESDIDVKQIISSFPIDNPEKEKILEEFDNLKEEQSELEEIVGNDKFELPVGTKGVLIARLVEDDSDLMSDYHGCNRLREVIVGFSKHTRNNFNEMRKAASQSAIPEVKALGTLKNKDHEHRENYSMGGGYYLKDGWRYDDGWSIHKVSDYGDREYFINRFISLIMSTKMLVEVNKPVVEEQKAQRVPKDDCLDLIQLKGGDRCQILKC